MTRPGLAATATDGICMAGSSAPTRLVGSGLWRGRDERSLRSRLGCRSGPVLATAVAGALAVTRYRRDMVAAYRRIAQNGDVLATQCGPIQYAELGAGPPVLIVHGAGGGYDQGAFFAGAIGGSFRWIAPSRFGFLGTPAPPGADSASQADAHACLLDRLQIDRVGVVGVSMGGPSALVFARRYPHRTTSLVLISAASHAIASRPALLAAMFEVFLHDFVFWALVQVAPTALLAALGVPSKVQRRLSGAEKARLIEFVRSIVPMAARRDGQLLEQHMSEYECEQIADIEAPTLIVHATDDTLIPFEHGQFSAQRIPRAELFPMKAGGHLALLLDANAGARNRVLEFLAQGLGR
jgi:pimeloyl-ACP methyl ester carboxylesterase